MEHQNNAAYSSSPPIVASDGTARPDTDMTSSSSFLSIEQVLFRHFDDDEFCSYISHAYHDRSWLLDLPSSALFNIMEFLFGDGIDLNSHEEAIKLLFYVHPGLYVVLPHSHGMFDYDLQAQRPFPDRCPGPLFPSGASVVISDRAAAPLSPFETTNGPLLPTRLFESSQSSASEPKHLMTDLSPASID
jgi:hypothetical protein